METRPAPGWLRVGPCEYANNDLPGYRIMATYDGYQVLRDHRDLGYATDWDEAVQIVSDNLNR